MEENKELELINSELDDEISSAPETDDNIAVDTDESVEADTQDNIADYLANFEDNGTEAEIEDMSIIDNIDNPEIEQPAKKKRLIQVPIIISIVIVLAALIALFVAKGFLDKSVVGTWLYNIPDTSTADEASPDSSADDNSMNKQYYIFEGDNTVTLNIGTLNFKGSYELSNDEETGQTMLILSISGSQGYFMYDVEGNIFTGRSLTLTNIYNNEEINFKGVNSIDKPELKVEEGFTPNESLTGKWIANTDYGKMSYTFNENGTVEINENDMVFAEGVYSYTKDSINITYYTTEEIPMLLKYSADENGLTLNGILYEADNGSSDKTEATVAETTSAE